MYMENIVVLSSGLNKPAIGNIPQMRVLMMVNYLPGEVSARKSSNN